MPAPEKLTPEQNRANDLIAAMQVQRNQALDQVVEAAAAVTAMQREVQDLKAELATVTAKLQLAEEKLAIPSPAAAE